MKKNLNSLVMIMLVTLSMLVISCKDKELTWKVSFKNAKGKVDVIEVLDGNSADYDLTRYLENNEKLEKLGLEKGTLYEYIKWVDEDTGEDYHSESIFRDTNYVLKYKVLDTGYIEEELGKTVIKYAVYVGNNKNKIKVTEGELSYESDYHDHINDIHVRLISTKDMYDTIFYTEGERKIYFELDTLGKSAEKMPEFEIMVNGNWEKVDDEFTIGNNEKKQEIRIKYGVSTHKLYPIYFNYAEEISDEEGYNKIYELDEKGKLASIFMRGEIEYTKESYYDFVKNTEQFKLYRGLLCEKYGREKASEMDEIDSFYKLIFNTEDIKEVSIDIYMGYNFEFKENTYINFRSLIMGFPSILKDGEFQTYIDPFNSYIFSDGYKKNSIYYEEDLLGPYLNWDELKETEAGKILKEVENTDVEEFMEKHPEFATSAGDFRFIKDAYGEYYCIWTKNQEKQSSGQEKIWRLSKYIEKETIYERGTEFINLDDKASDMVLID